MIPGSVVIQRLDDNSTEVAPTVVGTASDTIVNNSFGSGKVSDLFAATDDNGDVLTYQIKYSGNSGSTISLNGNTISNGTWTSLSAQALDNLTITYGSNAATDDLEVKASDGTLTTDAHIAVKFLNQNDYVNLGNRKVTGQSSGIYSQKEFFTINERAIVTFMLNGFSSLLTIKDANGNIISTDSVDANTKRNTTKILNAGAYFA